MAVTEVEQQPIDRACELAKNGESPAAHLRRVALAAQAEAERAERPEGETVGQRARRFGYAGCPDSGIPDLATNPKYMEDFGK